MIYPYYEKSEVLKTEKACGYLLAETENNDIVELLILKDGVVPAHALPIDVVFYVISGRGKITITNEVTNALKGYVIAVKKNLDRTWQNPFDEPLKLLVIKQKP